MKAKLVIVFVLLLQNLVFSQNRYRHPRGIPAGEDRLYKSLPKKTIGTRDWVYLPESKSLKKFAPTPKSQGQFGTCTGWAVAYAGRTIMEAKQKGWTNKYDITQNAFSAVFQYRCAENRPNCDGAYTSEVIKTMQTRGSVPMNKLLIDARDEPLCPPYPVNSTNFAIAKRYKIEEFATLWTYDFTKSQKKINRVKESIYGENPVVISMICPESFDEIGSDGLWKPTESPDGDVNGRQHGRHAMCVVGYDNNKFGGAFEVQNSWGESFGNGGYVWIKYSDFARFVYQAFELIKLPKPKPKEPYLSGSLKLYDVDKGQYLKTVLNYTPSNQSKTTYKTSRPLASGSRMRMYLKSGQPAFVYLLGTGSKNKNVKILFPVEGYSPAVNYPNTKIALPSQKNEYIMDNTIGQDYIVMLYSKVKLDIKTLKKTFQNTEGSIRERLHKTLDHFVIPLKHVKFSNQNIEFSVEANNSNKKAMALVIEFEHIARK